MTDKKDKVINLENAKQSKEIYDLGGLLPQIFSHFSKDLKPKLIACFESLDDTLFDLSEKADSNQNQTLYFETMRDIRKKRPQVFADFFNNLKASFKSFKNNKFDYFAADFGFNSETKSLSLSLVDEKELDETLAKTNLINKSDMAYHRQLFAFEKRFSVLASGTDLKANQIPVSPHVIVNSFSKCLNNLDIDINIKLIIYKLFERNIMGQLNNIYTFINEFLSNKGIVPVITYNIGQQGQSQNLASTNDPRNNLNNGSNYNPQANYESEHSNNTVNNINNSNTQQNIDPNYQLISQFFSKSRQTDTNEQSSNIPTQTGNINNNVSIPSIDMGSMFNALTSLQQNLFKGNDYVNQSPTDIKNELLKHLYKPGSSTADQKVQQKDEDTIDLVGMLFQFIVDDRNLPDAIQVILAKLQIPYLKIALKNRNLFADRSHPARILLDKLSIESVGWSKESDRNNIFINKIEKITHELLELEDYDKDVYLKLTHRFDQFLEKQKKKSDVVQKRSKEKALGQDKIENAKKQVAQLMVDKIKNHEMPFLIRDILLGEWANVLILMHLRYGKDSEEFKKKSNFIDIIINNSQLKPGITVTSQIIKKISNRYEEGLKIVAFNPKESLDKQHKLIECLNKVHGIDLDKSVTSEVEVISPSEILKLSEIRKQHDIVEFIEEIIEPKEKENTEIIEADIVNMIETMKIGTWLEFIKSETDNFRAKLSWISPITSKYLFVNSRGLKITDKSSQELASGIKNKSIRILQQVALFDRALSAIADKIKDTKVAETTGNSET